MSKLIDIIFAEIIPGDALKKALSMTPEEVREIIKVSKLRGRGGAGFPTGLKWELTAKSDAARRYVVCNADEGEPGTFKDRMILEKQCPKVIESMCIAAYGAEASQGYLYLRGEYAYLKKGILATVETFRKRGLLGSHILGSDLNFDITLRLGAGAYICGEETALLESLEGKRGVPRNKPPYPVTAGMHGAPTVINNVETLAFVPHIILEGAPWFKGVGTASSSGSKLFSVSGDCESPGIYEFEFGVTIQELLKEVGASRNTKAVQIGGAGGICAARADFDKPLSFEGIPTGGSIIVFDETRDMLSVLKNFFVFFNNESCGQCSPCREGSFRLLEGIEKFEQGAGSQELLTKLLKLCDTLSVASKCGLGQSIPNSFRTITAKFPDEIMGRSL